MREYQTDKNNIVFNQWPGGLKSMAGGERTEIRLSRPWQKMWSDGDRAQCPFCNFMEEDHVVSPINGWHVKTNKFPIYDTNRIIFPETCWANGELYELGDAEKIKTALKIAKKEIDASPDIPLVVSANIGFLAGQNYPHLHYHLQSVLGKKHTSRVAEEMNELYKKRKDFILFGDNITIGVGGVRSGQCFILPQTKDTSSDAFLSELSSALYRLITLCKKKFTSTQGFPPDFTIALYFEKASFSYGLYAPILSNWGATEYLTLYEEDSDVLLRWPHEVTAAYLKGN